MASPPSSVRPAAQYLRRSTGLQSCSPEQQAIAIAAYAKANGYEIVHTFQDDRSGLDLKGRPGLRALLAEALGGAPGFQAILVHDVSRWGRFQDLDQGAHYEFLCRKAGLAVEYCVEPFDNDGSPEAYVLKQSKRYMAAEYSRQLSDRIASAKRHMAAKGFLQTGTCPFGYRRLVVDAAGKPRAILERGEYKASSGHRTVLVAGPDDEVTTVGRIFRLYALAGLRTGAIAKQLTAEGVAAGPAKAWTSDGVARLLRNEVYVGDYVFGRTSQRLKGPVVPRSPETWVRVPGAVPALVSRPRVEAAQRALAFRRPRTEAEMLDDLRALLAERGRLDSGLIDEACGTRGACAYIARFGGLRRAYARIGYRRGRRSHPAEGVAG